MSSSSRGPRCYTQSLACVWCVCVCERGVDRSDARRRRGGDKTGQPRDAHDKKSLGCARISATRGGGSSRSSSNSSSSGGGAWQARGHSRDWGFVAWDRAVRVSYFRGLRQRRITAHAPCSRLSVSLSLSLYAIITIAPSLPTQREGQGPAGSGNVGGQDTG